MESDEGVGEPSRLEAPFTLSSMQSELYIYRIVELFFRVYVYSVFNSAEVAVTQVAAYYERELIAIDVRTEPPERKPPVSFSSSKFLHGCS